MKTEQFNDVVAKRIESIQSVLVAKAKEYSNDVDRFEILNFRRIDLQNYGRIGNQN